MRPILVSSDQDVSFTKESVLEFTRSTHVSTPKVDFSSVGVAASMALVILVSAPIVNNAAMQLLSANRNTLSIIQLDLSDEGYKTPYQKVSKIKAKTASINQNTINAPENSEYDIWS